MSTQNFKQAVEAAAKKIGIDMIGFASKAAGGQTTTSGSLE